MQCCPVTKTETKTGEETETDMRDSETERRVKREHTFSLTEN